ncbi:MAG: 50S ribosomal protein L6, partial [Candidatus Delongbacteria bacterium]|nr:50S ribosomal protein L6 [Candidatus Delongbacteria bacterium]
SVFGLTRALINNMVVGVSAGFEQQLEIIGIGYNAKLGKNALLFALGYSHPIYFALPAGITAEVPDPTKIIIRGIDKHMVGQVAANIRRLRPPEPYKGKGIRYKDEEVRRKAGKTAGK